MNADHRRLSLPPSRQHVGGPSWTSVVPEPLPRRAVVVRWFVVLLLVMLSGGGRVSAAQSDDRDPRETPTDVVVVEPSPTAPPTVAPPVETPTPVPPSPTTPATEVPTPETPPPTTESHRPTPTSPALGETPTPTGSVAVPTTTATATASPTATPSPLATVPNGAGTLLLSPGASTSATPGEIVEFVHTLTYAPVASESATVHVAVQGPKGWPLSVSTRVDAPPLIDSDGDTIPDQLTLCVPAERVPCTADLIVRLSVPPDAAGNKDVTVVVSVALSRDGQATSGRTLQASVTESQLITATDHVSIQANLTVTIIGGRNISFGAISPNGSTVPAPGVTAVAIPNGYQYTYEDAVTIRVHGAAGAWTALCYVASPSGVMNSLQVSADGVTFTPVATSAPGSACLAGSGNATLTLDLRVTVTWADAAGPSGGQLVFTVGSS